jgi:DNA replication protein DnaC
MPLLSDIDKKTPEQMQLIEKFALKPRGFMVLSGKNGTGKSFVAQAIYELHAPYKLPYYDKDVAYFVTQAKLNSDWLDQKHEGSVTEMLTRLKGTKLLIIDDLGTRTPTDAFMDFLFDLFDTRWNNRDKLGTIITTNLNSADMRLKFSDAIVSRIASGICMRFEGEDRRFMEF